MCAFEVTEVPLRRERFRFLNWYMGAAIAAVLALRLALLFRLNIHWDEFLFLSQIFDLKGERLADGLQTFHTRLLLPLAFLNWQEVDIIVAGRVVMFCFSVLSSYFLFLLARQRTSSETAGAAVFVWLSMSETLIHGSSFRSDPLLLFLITAGCLLFDPSAVLAESTRARFGRIFTSSLFLGIAIAISLKAFVLIPLLWLPYLSVRRRIIRLCVTMILAVLIGCAIFLLHSQLIVPREDPGLLPVGTTIGARLRILLQEFLFSREPPRGVQTLLRSLGENPVAWIFILSAIAVGALANAGRRAFLSCAVPFCLVSMGYRNAFPYFLPATIFPITMFAAEIHSNVLQSGRRLALTLSLLLLVNTSLTVNAWWQYGTEQQRKVIAAVHRVFPKPVLYFDRCGMISSFPRAGPFLSTLVLERYKKLNQPFFQKVIAESPPSFLLQNTPIFVPGTPEFASLHPLDRDALAHSYFAEGAQPLRLNVQLFPSLPEAEKAMLAEDFGEAHSLFAPY